jgi:hypothetical protein
MSIQHDSVERVAMKNGQGVYVLDGLLYNESNSCGNEHDTGTTRFTDRASAFIRLCTGWRRQVIKTLHQANSLPP